MSAAGVDARNVKRGCACSRPLTAAFERQQTRQRLHLHAASASSPSIDQSGSPAHCNWPCQRPSIEIRGHDAGVVMPRAVRRAVASIRANRTGGPHGHRPIATGDGQLESVRPRASLRSAAGRPMSGLGSPGSCHRSPSSRSAPNEVSVARSRRNSASLEHDAPDSHAGRTCGSSPARNPTEELGSRHRTCSRLDLIHDQRFGEQMQQVRRAL